MTKPHKEHQATYRQQQEAKGLVYYQKWITPELSALYAKIKSAYESKGKLWDDIVKLVQEYKD